MEKSYTCKDYDKAFEKSNVTVYQRIHIRGKNPMNVVNIKKSFFRGKKNNCLSEKSKKRNPMNVKKVGKFFPGTQHLLYMKEVLLERNPLNIKNIGNSCL